LLRFVGQAPFVCDASSLKQIEIVFTNVRVDTAGKTVHTGQHSDIRPITCQAQEGSAKEAGNDHARRCEVI
jgi:hypothetical protein